MKWSHFVKQILLAAAAECHVHFAIKGVMKMKEDERTWEMSCYTV